MLGYLYLKRKVFEKKIPVFRLIILYEPKIAHFVRIGFIYIIIKSARKGSMTVKPGKAKTLYLCFENSALGKILNKNFLTSNFNYLYFIFQCQLLLTFGFICLFKFHEGTKLWALHNQWLFYVSIAVLFITLICMACCESVRRTAPMNFIFLGLFTLAQGFMLGCTTIRFSSDEVGVTSTKPNAFRKMY